jgi:hypothetical protein
LNGKSRNVKKGVAYFKVTFRHSQVKVACNVVEVRTRYILNSK